MSDMNSTGWDALEYKYPLHILSFLVFVIKNPATPNNDIINITIIHHFNLHV